MEFQEKKLLRFTDLKVWSINMYLEIISTNFTLGLQRHMTKLWRLYANNTILSSFVLQSNLTYKTDYFMFIELFLKKSARFLCRLRSFQKYLGMVKPNVIYCRDKVLSFLEACFDLISSSPLSMKIQIMGGKITENPGFKSPLRKVKFFVFILFLFSDSSHKTGYL